MTSNETTDRARRLATDLGMPEFAAARLAALPFDTELSLPTELEAEAILDLCAVHGADREAMLAARPDPQRDPDWWMLLRGVVGELRATMDVPLPPLGYSAWPVVPPSSGPVGMFLYAWALMAVVPELLAVQNAHGVPREVTAGSVSHTLPGLMNSHLQVTGQRGVGLFPLWGPPLVFRGADITLGRLTFTRTQLAVGDGPAAWALQVHVPPTGALDPDVVGDAIETAIGFVAQHYPDEPIGALACVSWLLDPQLAEYLAPESRILVFQRLFHVLPFLPFRDEHEGDRELMRLGLQLEVPAEGALSDEDLARVPTDTTLQRAFVRHIRSGRHWQKRTGMLFPEEARR